MTTHHPSAATARHNYRFLRRRGVNRATARYGASNIGAVNALIVDMREADPTIDVAEAACLAVEVLAARDAAERRGHSPEVIGHYTAETVETHRAGATIGTRTVVRPSGGAPTGWSGKMPTWELPRHESRVTRSRKRGSSFVVTRRHVYGPDHTVGDDGYVAHEDETDGVGVACSVHSSETALIAAADRLLIEHGAYDGLGLIGRHKARPQVFGGSRWRGFAGYRLPVDDRTRAWCEFHQDGAERCQCAISHRAAPGVLMNAGAHAGTNETLKRQPRTQIARRNRPCPVCGQVPSLRRGAPICEHVGYVVWADHGAFVGTTFVRTVTRAERRAATVAARAAKREAERTVAQSAAEARRSNLDAMLAALRTAGTWSPRDGVTVTRDGKGKYVVATRDAITTHATPAAVLQRVA